MCVGELGKQGNTFLKMRISKRGGSLLYYLTWVVAMMYEALALLLNTMRCLAYKLGGNGDVWRMMEKEGNPQATMEA